MPSISARAISDFFVARFIFLPSLLMAYRAIGAPHMNINVILGSIHNATAISEIALSGSRSVLPKRILIPIPISPVSPSSLLTVSLAPSLSKKPAGISRECLKASSRRWATAVFISFWTV